ncbi:MAG: rhomboid family intramembrane serine protease [Clostridiales bacterium]|nr:rhomboid family intramembrane serine protease [Clostridiales bacterium]
MKIEDGIIKLLSDMEFQRLNVQRENIEMFYRSNSIGTDIILILRSISGTEITSDEYRLIVNNVKNQFVKNGFTNINLLGLIITAAADRAKRYLLEEEDHFIIDLSHRRLLVYEDQSSYFSYIISSIEDIIHDKSYETGDLECNKHKVGWITLFNTIIVVANIIIHLLAHHTNVFGYEGYAFNKGSLSWYFIKEEREYYRILTSMFLHSDFEHLINNMLVLFFVGDNLERTVGRLKYLWIYFGSGIIAGIVSISYNMIKQKHIFSIGASGAIFGVVGAMGYILLVNKGHVNHISSRQIALFTIFSLYGGIANANIDNAAHIGGFIGGIIIAILLYRRPKEIKDNKAS